MNFLEHIFEEGLAVNAWRLWRKFVEPENQDGDPEEDEPMPNINSDTNEN